MKEIQAFFTGIFDTTLWPRRWNCGSWSDFHGWLYIISDWMIWIAYFMIPVIILRYFTGKKGLVKYSRVYLLFAAFILLCGSTHFLDAMMFWIPMYRLNALVRFATGVVSLATAYHLVKILPEAFRQKTNIELEQEIARRQQAEQQLAAANANLEAFAYIASHDLQEPLRKISTFTSMLYRNNAANMSNESKAIASKIEASCERMQGMIADVLALATIRENNIAFQPVSLQQAVALALDDLEIKLQEKNAIVKVNDLPIVNGKLEYLSQLFSNLISNAVKFSTLPPVIEIGFTEQAGHQLVYVKDNGIGMAPEDTQRIFVAFQRLHSRAEYDGSGIGLAICKKIVDVHGGEIKVSSEPGKGTTFFIAFPKKQVAGGTQL